MDAAATVVAPVAIADRLSLPRKLGFTLGDYACNIYWQSLSLFLLFFYTDVVGLSAATAGWIYMVASIWDGAIDPLIGAVADRTRSRFGRYRPYILFGSVPLAVSFCLLYYKPPFQGTGLVVVVTRDAHPASHGLCGSQHSVHVAERAHDDELERALDARRLPDAVRDAGGPHRCVLDAAAGRAVRRHGAGIHGDCSGARAARHRVVPHRVRRDARAADGSKRSRSGAPA